MIRSKPYMYMLFVLLNLALCEATVVEINLNYNTQTKAFSLDSSKLLETSLPGGIREDSEYKWILFSVNDVQLDKGNIIIPGPMIVERDQTRNLSTQVIYPENQVITLYFDYNPRLRNLIVHNLFDELLNIDLMEYNRCNLNSVCDSNENRLLCPEDCPDSLKDGMCRNIEDGLCQEDPDCPNRDPDCIIQESRLNRTVIKENITHGKVESKKPNVVSGGIKSNLFPLLLILLGCIAIILLLSIFIYRKRKAKSQP